MNILITGGSGFLGKRLIADLINGGDTVTAIGREGFNDSRISWIHHDLLESPSQKIKNKLKDIDVVIHLAAIMPSKVEKAIRSDIIHQNTTITRNVLSLVDSPQKFILASSVDVYPYSDFPSDENTSLRPVSDYGLSKKKSEEVCLQWSTENHKTKLLILRFSHIYGPADTNTKMIDALMRNALLGKKSVIYCEGIDKRTYLFVEDAVLAIQCCLQNQEAGMFNVGGSDAYSIKEVIVTVEKILSLKMKVENVIANKKKGDSIISSAKIAKRLRFAPMIGLQEGLRSIIPKNIFFDLDGPILDVKERYYAVYRQFVLEKKGTPLSIDEYWQQKRLNISLGDLLLLSKCEGIDVAEFKRHLSKYREQLSNLKLDRLQPMVKEILEHLSKNYSLYLITLRRNTENLLRQLEELGILTYFTKVLTMAPTSEDKWDHKVELLKEYHLETGAGLILGDTPTEIMTAKKLGFTSIAVSNGIRTKEILLEAQPHLLIESIEEVCSLPFYSLLFSVNH